MTFITRTATSALALGLMAGTAMADAHADCILMKCEASTG